VLSVSDHPAVVLFLVLVFLILIGMVLDGVSIYIILIPILMPIVSAFQWNPVWFGIVMAMTIAIGQFTPPVAVNLLVTSRIAGVSIESTLGWTLWFVLSMIVALALIVLFPAIALWLPEVLGYRV